ncbi:hypothetical protein Sste5346_003109 [Sporothrix stenoceras]|uniref:Uncharacterized protein n=1 Tax=Sporothrix stenoceras TaxID=5173 RepID=A0ABR3ZG80_9PEZI
MVVQNGLPYPFFGLSGDVWVEAVLSLTPEGYLEQQGTVEQGGVFGYAGFPYILLAPLSYYTSNAGYGFAPAICTLNKATSAVDCAAAGYGPQLYSAIPNSYSVDYDLFWTDGGDGINNSPMGTDQYLPASLSYVEVDCPSQPQEAY